MNLPVNTGHSSLMGASRLIINVETAVASFLKNPKIIVELNYPTIATQREKFSPVLFLSRLIAVTGYTPDVEELPLKLKRTYGILRIIEELHSGAFEISRNSLRYIKQRMGISDSAPRDTKPLFDLFYGALQLLVHAELVEPETADDFHDLFIITCGIGLVVAESINSRTLPFHIDHFKAHAAVFLAARNTVDSWLEVRDQSISYLEKWGDEPPPESVLIHAAHNLFIQVKGLPNTDQVYELIKAARKEVSNKQLDFDSAFTMLNNTLGWRQSSALIRLLWDTEYRQHYTFTRDTVANRLNIEGYKSALEYAQKIQFVGDDGQPLIKSPPNIPIEEVATLSFPGGAGIGKTSIICKIAGSYIMIDYGRDSFGRTPHWRPEMDLLDAVLITHAHQDHIGGLLDLYGRQGYKGRWYAPAESEALIRLSLLDSVALDKAKFKDKARHKEEDVTFIFEHFNPLKMGALTSITERISVTAFPAGHVIGSCQYLLEGNGTSIFFSGDFNLASCRSVPPLVLPSKDVLERIDALVVEGTYAFREEAIMEAEEAISDLLRVIREQVKRPVLVPVLSLGRAQEVIAALSETELKVGVFGLAKRMTKAMDFHLGSNVTLEERLPQNVGSGDYDVLIASSGCLQGGPSKVFYERQDLHPIPTVLTGYLFPGTPARSLADQLPRIRFSAHAGHNHWTEYLAKFPNASHFLIHYPGNRNVLLPVNLTIPKLGRAYLVDAK